MLPSVSQTPVRCNPLGWQDLEGKRPPHLSCWINTGENGKLPILHMTYDSQEQSITCPVLRPVCTRQNNIRSCSRMEIVLTLLWS
jgi:hypothetical protein